MKISAVQWGFFFAGYWKLNRIVAVQVCDATGAE